jgi:hypothetical protein
VVERSRVTELHYITTLDNIESILKRGLLSHTLAAKIPHSSIANVDVQARRAVKIPNGLALHDYVNTYFDARNAMMYDVRGDRDDYVVLRISPSILDMPGAIITDGNAACIGTRFDPSPAGLENLDETRVYARFWTQPSWEYYERKRQRQAEVLVPHRIPVQYLIGGYVRRDKMVARCRAVDSNFDVRVDKRVFFDD